MGRRQTPTGSSILSAFVGVRRRPQYVDLLANFVFEILITTSSLPDGLLLIPADGVNHGESMPVPRTTGNMVEGNSVRAYPENVSGMGGAGKGLSDKRGDVSP